MSNQVLFIFEGEKTEEKIIRNLEKYFVNESTNICCAFCAEIYQLYKQLESDPFLDLFVLLKEKKQNAQILAHYERDDFAEVYLFFDYDGHATEADDEKIKELLRFYDEETANGKLYLSYPMIESLKHLGKNVDFQNLAVPAKSNINYKSLVSEECDNELNHLAKYNHGIWKHIVIQHLCKMNYVVNGLFVLPDELIQQNELFKHQDEKYIKVDESIAVISAFPPFLLDYYGCKMMQEKLM